MNPRLILLLGCLALPVNGQESTTVAPEVSNLLAQPDDADKQRNILHLLPKFVSQSSSLEALSGNMRLDFLEAADCSLLARTALEIERTRRSNLANTRPPQRGGVVDPVAQIGFRLKHLVLPDVEAFDRSLDQSTDGGWTTLGQPYRFWSLLVLWIDKHGIKSPEALAIKAEVERFVTQSDSAQPEAAVKPLLSVDAAKETPEAKPTPTTLSEEPTSSTTWGIIVVLIVAATGLLWSLLKGRK